MFQGVLTNETRCLTCETVTRKDESFLDLSLEIEQNTSISSCLRNFTSQETLRGQDKFHCDCCQSKQEAVRRIQLKKLPVVLVLHLKRFKYVEQLERFKKLVHRVVFPFELRLDSTTREADGLECLYELFAVVMHIGGSPNSGHYVTLIRHSGRWLRFDDESIDIAEEHDFHAAYGSTTEMVNHVHRTDCAYLLFYIQKT